MIKDTLIVMFAFNRPDHFSRVFEALKKNPEFSDLSVRIYQDGKRVNESGKWDDMRKLAERVASENINVELICRERNFGCRESIIQGITDSLKAYRRAIILEDDIRVSKTFLRYMLDALDYYQDTKNVSCISGYNHPKQLMKIPSTYRKDVYFSLRTCSWGWATWSDRWESIDWDAKDFKKFKMDFPSRFRFSKIGDDLFEMLEAQLKGKLNAWDIVWTYHCFKHNLYTVYPVVSFVENIGNDDSGENCKATNKDLFENANLNERTDIVFIKPFEDKDMAESFRDVYRRNISYYKRKIISKIKKIVNK